MAKCSEKKRGESAGNLLSSRDGPQWRASSTGKAVKGGLRRQSCDPSTCKGQRFRKRRLRLTMGKKKTGVSAFPTERFSSRRNRPRRSVKRETRRYLYEEGRFTGMPQRRKVSGRGPGILFAVLSKKGSLEGKAAGNELPELWASGGRGDTRLCRSQLAKKRFTGRTWGKRAITKEEKAPSARANSITETSCAPRENKRGKTDARPGEKRRASWESESPGGYKASEEKLSESRRGGGDTPDEGV